MQLESLKIFCDVVRWASFSRGAAENGVSQPSASQAVHQLEARLGVKLIDRSKRPLVLTAHGKVYYEGCKDLVGRYLEVESRVMSLDDASHVVGTVRVASIYSVGLNHMSQFKHSFEDSHPGASVRVEYLHPTRVVESVAGGGAELGLISFPKKWPDLTVIPWRDEEIVLAVYPSHRFAGCGEIDVRELDHETFVSYDADLSIRRVLDRALRHYDLSFNVSLEFDNIENIKRGVESREGVALLPEPTLAHEAEAGTLVAVRLANQDPRHRLKRPLAIIHRRQDQLGVTAARFLKLLMDEGGSAPASGRASEPSTSAAPPATNSERRATAAAVAEPT